MDDSLEVESILTDMTSDLTKLIRKANDRLKAIGNTENVEYLIAFYNVAKSTDELIQALQKGIDEQVSKIYSDTFEEIVADFGLDTSD